MRPFSIFFVHTGHFDVVQVQLKTFCWWFSCSARHFECYHVHATFGRISCSRDILTDLMSPETLWGFTCPPTRFEVSTDLQDTWSFSCAMCYFAISFYMSNVTFDGFNVPQKFWRLQCTPRHFAGFNVPHDILLVLILLFRDHFTMYNDPQTILRCTCPALRFEGEHVLWDDFQGGCHTGHFADFNVQRGISTGLMSTETLCRF